MNEARHATSVTSYKKIFNKAQAKIFDVVKSPELKAFIERKLCDKIDDIVFEHTMEPVGRSLKRDFNNERNGAN